MVLLHCSVYRHKYVTQNQIHSTQQLNFIQFKNAPGQTTKKKVFTEQINST